MCRFIVTLFIFIAASVQVYASDELSACVLKRGNIQATAQTAQPICSATILDRNTIIYEQSCTRVANPRALQLTSYFVSCHNDSISYKVPAARYSQRDAKHKSLKLDVPIAYFPTKHHTNEKLSSCIIKSANRTAQIRATHLASDIAKLRLSKTASAAPIICKSESNTKEELLAGVVSSDGKFIPISELQEKYQLESDFVSTLEDTAYSEDSALVVCHNASECIANLITPAIELNEQLNEIISKLNGYERTSIAKEREQLTNEFRELEKECHRKSLQAKLSYSNIEEADFGDKTMGVIERGAIGVFNFFGSINPFDKEEFLYTTFKNIGAISQNLSDARIKEIFDDINNQDIGNFDKIRNLASAYSKEVVNLLLDDMKTFSSAQEKQAFVEPYLKDLDKCLEKAVRKDQVIECSNVFTNNIALSIGEKELEKQIGLNFTPEDGLPTLKSKSTNAYMKCVNENFNKFEKVIDTTSVVKGCVYTGILESYHRTRAGRVNDAIKAYTGRSENNAIVGDILRKSNNCSYAPIVNSKGQTPQEYLVLAKMSTEQFTKTIGECIDSLKVSATYDVVEIAILTNPKISESLSQDEKNLLIEEIKTKHLPACMSAKKTTDGNECSAFITAMATAQAAKSILAIEFDKQFDSLGIDEEKRAQLSQRIIKDYEVCIEHAKREIYRDLTKDVNENLINQCLTGAITSLSGSILKDSIYKATSDKGIADSVVNSAISSQELRRVQNGMKSCLENDLAKHTKLSSYQENMNETISSCTFKTQRNVIGLIAKEMAHGQVKDFNLPATELSSLNRFIENHINNSGPENLDSNVDTLTPLLIKRVAPGAIDKTLEDFKSKFTKEQFEDAKNKISTQLNSCLDQTLKEKESNDEVNATQAASVCMSVTVKDAYRSLAPKIIEETIVPLFNGEPNKVKALTESSSRNLMKCLDSVEDDVKAQENAKDCLSGEIGNIAKTIARTLLTDLNKFANPNETLEDFTKSQAYREFERCIERPNKPSLEEATENMNTCVTKLEEQAKEEVKGRFVQVYGDQNPDQLGKVMDILLTIPAKSQETGFKEEGSSDGMPNAQLISTLELVGSTLKYSCDNNTAICDQAIHNTTIAMQRHSLDNPSSTTAQNTQALMESEMLENLITSQLGMNLNQVFKKELATYNGPDNLVLDKIDDITNNRLLTDIMRTREGRELKEYILKKVEEGAIDNIAEDPNLRKLLANALTKDTSDGSFGDQLSYALVQTELNRMKKRSRGLRGFFREFTINAGDLFNIIDKKDFKWSKITRTRTGVRAREYMIREIIAPAIEGRNLSAEAASSKKHKNQQEERLDRFKSMLTDALKEANKL
ncbi:hypothetical protein ABMA79_11630 [Halobacteriovorax sp. HFRX-2_2]|uniref:hypothetical protein n=1 Tax=unclassified Halobacteriovorax TaxID=2639665 RepID=UPI00371434C8